MNFELCPSMSNYREMSNVVVRVNVVLRLIVSFEFHFRLDSVEQCRLFPLIRRYHRDYSIQLISFRVSFDAENELNKEDEEKHGEITSEIDE